jgi:hypothetical protein
MSLTRADIVADVCIFGGALVLAASAMVRPANLGYQRAVRRQIRRTLLGGAVVVLSLADSTQVWIDRLSGVHNLGLLVRLVLLPVVTYRSLALMDTLIDASSRRRRWHTGFAVAAVAVTIVCWQAGVPHDRSLATIPVAVPLGGANRWLYALAWLFCAELIVQYGDAAHTAFRILLHVYAAGYDRATCLSSLLYGLAQGCFFAVGVGLLLYPPGQATGHFRWIDVSTLTTEFFGLTGAVLCLLAYAAPLWGSGRGQQAALPDRLGRLLRVLLLLSTYGAVRRLALHVQSVLPEQRVALGGTETSIWRVRRVADLSLLLQLFKTVINDARLVLLPYVSQAASGSADPERAARALASALANYRRGHQPPQEPDMENPLRAGHLFNDERFLAALWRAHQDMDHAI